MIAAAQRTRAALSGTTGVGNERVLAELARSPAGDDAWLQSVDAFGTLHADDSLDHRLGDRIVAVILLEPIKAACATPG